MSLDRSADKTGRQARRRTIVAGIAGNVMEWYDFSVYGYFAAVIGSQFFPAKDPTSSLLAAFGVFAAGFLMRPLGGLIFGHIGDKLGRKRALTVSVLVMAVPTFLIGLLPTYRQIGVAAPLLLVLLRLVQGTSVGGEYTTSSIFLVEHAPAWRRGLLGSFAPFGSCTGILIGSAVGAIVTTVLDPGAVHAWGWRLAFIAGLAVGGIGFLLRRHLADDRLAPGGLPPVAAPVREALTTEWRMILRIIAMNAAGAVAFYMCFVYFTTYLRRIDLIEPSKALDANTLAIVVLLALMIPMGSLSDRIGRKPLLLAATIGMLLFAWPIFWLLHHANIWVALIGQLGLAVLNACYWGPCTATLVELVPARLRCSVFSIGYNAGVGVLGGATPMLAVYTIKRTHDDLSPSVLLMVAAVVSIAVILGLRESYRMALPGAVERAAPRAASGAD